MSGRESLAPARPMIGRMVLHYRARDLRLGREVALKLREGVLDPQ